MLGATRSALASTTAFAASARTYWLEVFPEVSRERARWRATAVAIPDPRIRRLALAASRRERGNLEGAAAFAVLAPRSQRRRLVRAAVAFQAAYDYLDALAEQPGPDPRAHGRQLHLALACALEPGAGHRDYFARRPGDGDGGYARRLVEVCAEALAGLPSWGAALAPAAAAARRMVAYQSLNHAGAAERAAALAPWAAALTPAGSGLRWWETAAAAASSLGVFALMAAAARPGLAPEQADATAAAYFPWIGALHVLLDSLVDAGCDALTGEHSLIAHYGSAEETARRLQAIADRALTAARSLPGGVRHALITIAMASFYLSSATARAPHAAAARRRVLLACGGLAGPSLLLLRLRRAIGGTPR